MGGGEERRGRDEEEIGGRGEREVRVGEMEGRGR